MNRKYDFRTEEERMQRFWEEQEIYRFREEDPEKGGSAEDASGREGGLFSVDTPPTTVSGKLHIGHVFSYTLRYLDLLYHCVEPVSYGKNSLEGDHGKRFCVGKAGRKDQQIQKHGIRLSGILPAV